MAYYYIMITAPMTCLNLNRLQKSDGRIQINYNHDLQQIAISDGWTLKNTFDARISATAQKGSETKLD